jgi:hypothetical protein
MPTVKVVETKVDKAEQPEIEEITKMPKVLSPPEKATVPKVKMGSVVTPKRRRMVNVLDVLETAETLNPAPTGKVAEASKAQIEVDTKQVEVGAAVIKAKTDAGPSVPAETKLAAIEQKTEGKSLDTGIVFEKSVAKEVKTLTPEALSEDFDYIVRHALGKRLSEEEIFEAKHYARELKYPKGALVFNGTDEDDFWYCLPDNKELSVCQEMARSMGFPKLEAGLCAMKKADLADSLAYNSLKVQKL